MRDRHDTKHLCLIRTRFIIRPEVCIYAMHSLIGVAKPTTYLELVYRETERDDPSPF